MRDPHLGFATGMRLAHVALLRNLQRFQTLGGAPRLISASNLSDFVDLYVAFLDAHHQAEDEFIFPGLRRSAPGRSSDAAQLEQWTSAHRDIHAAGRDLASAAGKVRGELPGAEAAVARAAAALESLLSPHLADEDEALSAEHMREMISAAALEKMQRAIGKRMGARGLPLAAFLVHSLSPAEQREMLGEQPWLFRKVLLGVIGKRHMARFRELVFEPALAL
jgi:hemerythrin-like domain-containing protein